MFSESKLGLQWKLTSQGPNRSPVVQLSSGRLMPVIGLGTWRSDKGKVEAAVELAINSGYRHIDCAAVYANQEEIGRGIQKVLAKGSVKRENLFIVSKIWNSDHRADRVEPAARKILQELQLDYIDLLLIHWPVAFPSVPGSPFPKDDKGHFLLENVPVTETWQAMEKLVDLGLARDIGLSNFTIPQVDEILAIARVKPVCNQVECHPYFPQVTLHSELLRRGLALVGYSPLGNINPDDPIQKSPLNDPYIVQLAKQYGKTPAQILLRWAVDAERAALPKSVSPDRVVSNFELFDWHLQPEEIQSITALGHSHAKRMINPPFGPNGAKVFSN